VIFERTFRIHGNESDVLGRLELWLRRSGFEGGEQGVYRRGGRWSGLFSLRIERWPTEFRLALAPDGERSWLVTTRMSVQPGMHLVGALDELSLAMESALLEDALRRGTSSSLKEAVSAVRRPVYFAA
jgi:hypothetical protein